MSRTNFRVRTIISNRVVQRKNRKELPVSTPPPDYNLKLRRGSKNYPPAFSRRIHRPVTKRSVAVFDKLNGRHIVVVKLTTGRASSEIG